MYAETKHDADVVGFKSEGGPNTMETADMAASGVVVPGTNEPATTATESPASPQVEKPSAVQKPEQAEVPEKRKRRHLQKRLNRKLRQRQPIRMFAP